MSAPPQDRAAAVERIAAWRAMLAPSLAAAQARAGPVTAGEADDEGVVSWDGGLVAEMRGRADQGWGDEPGGIILRACAQALKRILDVR